MFELVIFLVLSIGLIIGSFIAALTWRMPRNVSIAKGRSFCPQCRKKINWYDNIPVISFFLLGGRCRNCKLKISPRYPAIELSTAIVYGILLYKFGISFEFVYYAFLSTLLIAIFVIDLEHMLIPDKLVFLGILASLCYLTLFNFPLLFLYLTAGFVAAVFFLFVTFVTAGKGMGLGDAKLAILIGSIVGPYIALYTFTLSFVVGAVIGIFLVVIGKAKLKKPIPFGPFMILGLFISLLLTNVIY